MKGNSQSHPHWCGDELLRRLYGLEDAATGCAECAARLDALRARAAGLRVEPALSDEFLRAQRQAVFARIEARRDLPFGWRAPVAATALLFVAAIALQKSEPVYYEPEIAAMSDAQFFAEIADVVDQDEPRATGAIQGLFEGTD
jgi:hypothetical protein